MFDILPLPPQLPTDVLHLLKQVDPPTVGHVLETGFMSPDFQSAIPGQRAVGTAVTVEAPSGDGLMITHALGLVRSGDILVIDRCGDKRHAAWGGILAAAAAAAGLAGVILDGPVCDLEAIRQSGVPVWYRGVSALTTKRLALGGNINLPVSCGGVAVRAGDAILADESGILVIAADRAAGIATKAIARQAREQDLLDQIATGKRTTEIFGTQTLIDEALAKRNGG